MTSLNPLHTIDRQIGETLMLHRGMSKSEARARALELLHLVRLQEADERLGAYPHQLSGGQRQRVMIAVALASRPDLLIADEPTTALDVTIQAQILKLLQDLQQRLGMAMLLITHDLTIVRKIADRVCVMTDGRIVETGSGGRCSHVPGTTQHLLAAEPKAERSRAPDHAPVVIGATGQGALRSSAVCCVARSVMSRRSTASMSRSGAVRRSAWSARTARARPRSAWRCCV